MKKLILFLLSILFTLPVFATPINKLVFFGDSLSDNGNLYSVLRFFPKSPPYFKGRFTNGITWAEHVGNYFYSKNYDDYQIYAVGGATATLHNLTTDKFFPPDTLHAQLYRYLARNLFTKKDTTLFFIWIGANDYLYEYSTNFDDVTNQVIGNIRSTIERLIKEGGKAFLVLNLPDLAQTPYSHENHIEDQLHRYTLMHNQKLLTAINEVQGAHPDVNIMFMNVYDTFSDVLTHIAQYNEKFHTNITNITQSCWLGGFLLKKNTIINDMRKSLAKTSLDPEMVANFIQQTPGVYQAYLTGKAYEAGVVPCEHAEEYVFWDMIHPTEVIHHIMGEIVVEKLLMENRLQFVMKK